MASYLNFNCISFFSLLVFWCPTLFAIGSSHPTQSLNINPSFDPEIDLFGDARIVDGGACVELTRSLPSSSGLLLHRKTIRFAADPTFSNPTSFSTEFAFSISPVDGDGIVLVLVPGNFSPTFPGNSSFGVSLENNCLGIEFDTSMDGNVGDLNANHVGLDVGSLVSAAVGNVSAMNMILNSGEKLKAWIDYDASSKRLEVRLGRLGEPRPYNPIIAHSIDLLEMWGVQDVLMGISSSNDGNSSQIINIYSWKLSLRRVSKWMHSLPVDPRGYSNQHKNQRRNYCTLTLLSGLIFVTGCVTLIAFILLFMWVIFVNRPVEFPGKIPVHPVDFRYKEIDVAVEKNADDDKN